jgi:hypothetical protein
MAEPDRPLIRALPLQEKSKCREGQPFWLLLQEQMQQNRYAG